MIKFLLILFLFFFGEHPIQKKNNEKQTNTLQVCNLFNDTVEQKLEGKVAILVFIKEPSCTGCKDYLAVFLNKLGKKYSQYIVLHKSESVLDKKTYNIYLNKKFKKSLGTYYSLTPQSLKVMIDNKEYNFNTKKTPFVVVISEMGNKIDTYKYDDIFEEVFVKDSFIDSIKKYK